MRRIVSVILALTLLLGLGLVNAEESEFVVGMSTKAGGYFLTEQWLKGGTDAEVRQLTSGLALFDWVSQKECVENPQVVKAYETYMDGADKVHVIMLQDDLKWSDGERITAKDYAFAILFTASVAIEEIGGKSAHKEISGYEEYREGMPFSGVNVLADDALLIKIKGEYLPNFYETSYLNIEPLPQKYLAPESAVEDAGSGAYLSKPIEKEELSKILFDEKDGYMSRPKVSSGAYIIDSFDKATGEVKLRVNPYFKGDVWGKKPTIYSVKLVYTSGDDAVEALEKGKVDMLAKLVSGNVIRKASALKGTKTSMHLRKGNGFLGFDLNDKVTGRVAVRQAIAHVISKVKFANELTKGYGGAVTGDYGFGMWIAAELAGKSEYELPDYKAFDNYQNIAIEKTDYSYSKARALLNKEGYVLNYRGGDYTEGEGARYIKTESGREELMLTIVKTEGSAAAYYVEKLAVPALKSIGFAVKVITKEFSTALNEYINGGGEGNVYILANEFDEVYNPLNYKWLTEEFDKELYDRAVEMQQAGDAESYKEAWLKYQNRFVELQPILPLYSGAVADVYNASLEGYTGENGLANGIIGATVNK